MLLKFENTDTETDTSFLKHATLWGPDSEEENNERDDDDWDEDGGGIDDPTEDSDDLNETQTDADIDDARSGNICRCATYRGIRKAIHLAAEKGGNK